MLMAATFSIVLGILVGGVCFGQIKSGTITGRVIDSTGAVIPGAKVSVVEPATKVATDTRTSDTGDYTVPFLEPAIYDVTVTKAGFSSFTQKGVTIGTGSTERVDAQLTVGKASTVVEVKGATATLQTETATLGDSVASNVIEEIPDTNQNPYYYATLQPGVTGRWELMDTTSVMSFGIGMYGRNRSSIISINGGTADEANISVDGINVQGSNWNEASVLPNPDAIEEVKTDTSSFDASIGRGEGAISIVTKSGTDQFHGSVFGRLRNEALNANSFANNAQGVPKPVFQVGYFGGTIGGPIKKNKAFFFVSYQGMVHNAADQSLLNVPAGNQAKGDFSNTLVNVSGVPTQIQLFNPFVATQVSPGLWQHPLITGPNGPSDLTQVADPNIVKLFSSYPAPNRTPIDVYNDDNYFFSGIQTYRSNSWNSRVDYTRGKHSVYVTGGIEYGHIFTPDPWGPTVPYNYLLAGTAAVISDHNPYAAVGDTIVLSPTLVLDLRIGMQRTHAINANKVYSNFDYSAVGLPASVQSILLIPGTAPSTQQIGSNNAPWTWLDQSYNDHKNQHQTNWDLAAGATKVKGNWTLKWGGEYLADFSNSPNPFYTGSAYANDGCAGCEYGDASSNAVAQDTNPAISGLGVAGLLMGAGYFSTLLSKIIASPVRRHCRERL
jgi:hypothetical protein